MRAVVESGVLRGCGMGWHMCLLQSLGKIFTRIVAQMSQPTWLSLSFSLVPPESLLEAELHVGKDLVSQCCSLLCPQHLEQSIVLSVRNICEWVNLYQVFLCMLCSNHNCPFLCSSNLKDHSVLGGLCMNHPAWHVCLQSLEQAAPLHHSGNNFIVTSQRSFLGHLFKSVSFNFFQTHLCSLCFGIVFC